MTFAESRSRVLCSSDESTPVALSSSSSSYHQHRPISVSHRIDDDTTTRVTAACIAQRFKKDYHSEMRLDRYQTCVLRAIKHSQACKEHRLLNCSAECHGG
ncbi:hypothetical protein WUBG_02304 [Wuchereria bancrofti]|uniref:Uncharacterized protein n=1 Tax=Wuchereria bancrofti TaxID=6293 RepID=J9EX64_WUCBA|nr:hypothetical protein WUBG_02304 [Wuchereria bancrofti]